MFVCVLYREYVSWMMCLMARSWGLVNVSFAAVVGVYVGSLAMMMSIPSGKVVAMLLVVMSVGSSGSWLSHCCSGVVLK